MLNKEILEEKKKELKNSFVEGVKAGTRDFFLPFTFLFKKIKSILSKKDN